MKMGGNKKHLDLFSQYFKPENGLVTLRHKYASVISDFYRKYVLFVIL